MLTPACLVTSTPDFEQAQQTPPFLITATANPDPTQILIIDDADLRTQQNSFEFSANVVSEDAGEQVEFQLYIDYGWPDSDLGQPFRTHIGDIIPLTPSTMADTNRRVTAKWLPAINGFGLGCHTVTLIASHHFDKSSIETSGCPVCRSDSSQITWQVYRCDSEGKTADSDKYPCNAPSFTECQGWKSDNKCPDYAGTGDGSQCGGNQ